MEKITYKKAGVNIEAGYQAVDLIKNLAQKTHRSEVLESIGGFNALFELGKYKNPVLISGTDGVGTKLKVAFLLDNHETVGIDLVAMCANDIITSGAEPLFFLDYIACGTLLPAKVAVIVQGITEGCLMAGCSLIGGETAEMPGFYQPDDYDLAGFIVGIVEKDNIINGSHCQAGDIIIGIESSGLHSNGYSLVRKVLLDKYSTNQYFETLGTSLGKELLKPTTIYVKPIHDILNTITVKAMSHITGGGFYENIPRTIPPDYMAIIHQETWQPPPIFQLIQQESGLNAIDMYHTFNMGIGFTLCIHPHDEETAMHILKQHGLQSYNIGYIQKNDGTTQDNNRIKIV